MKRTVIDNRIARLFTKTTESSLLERWRLKKEQQFSFGWSGLLTYLGQDSLFSQLALFDTAQPLFKACIQVLSSNKEKDVLFHLYDRLFTEILKKTQALKEVDAQVLLQSIRIKNQNPSIFSSILTTYETALSEHPVSTLHDLILYLSWDRMCIYLRQLFDYETQEPVFLNGISILRECLIESYLHIFSKQRTVPSLYRLIEALFFYEMRQENLNHHTVSEWDLLSKSFYLFDSGENLVDTIYIDERGREDTYYVTLDTSDRVQSKLALTHFLLKKLGTQFPGHFLPESTPNLIYLT